MAATYDLHLIGIVCLIRQSPDSYLVALPDGRDYDDPCSDTTLDTHLPYLIIPKCQVVSATIPGIILNDCFIVALERVGSLEFGSASSGGPPDDNDPVKDANGYLWSEIDPALDIDVNAPANTILTIALRQGKIVARRIPGDDTSINYAHIAQVTITQDLSGSFDVMVDGTERIEVIEGAELLVANVAPEWVEDVNYPDLPEHFNLYYRLGKLAPTACKFPTAKQPMPTNSQHPYLKEDRGLQLACSPTYYAAADRK